MKKTKKSKKTRKGEGVMITNSPGQFKTMSLVFPPRMLAKLRFNAYQLLSLAASTSANYRWRPTGAFDVDPALGGTAMAGFAELSGFYASYRVYSSRIKATIANPSAVSPITLIVVPLNADPTNAMTTTNIIACVENPYAQAKCSSLVGGPATTIVSSMSTQKIFGDPSVFYDHNFSSLVGAVPANNWFWNVAILAPAFIATAVTLYVTVDVDVEFFDRTFLPA